MSVESGRWDGWWVSEQEHTACLWLHTFLGMATSAASSQQRDNESKLQKRRCLPSGKVKVSIEAPQIINSFLQQMLTECQLHSKPCTRSMGDNDG